MSGLASLGLLILALIFILLGFADMLQIAVVRSQSTGMLSDSLPAFISAAACLVIGILLVPSAVYAQGRLTGRKPLDPLLNAVGVVMERFRPTLLIFLFPLVLLAGAVVVQISQLAWLLLPGLQVLAVGLPILWLLHLTVRGLPLGSPQRMWGVFGSGLALGPTLIVIGEILAGLLFLVPVILFLVSSPEQMDEVTALIEWAMEMEPTSDQMLEAFAPYLVNPAVILLALAFMSGVVPVLEELLKPIGVWLLFGRKMTPAAGFAAGALSGAGFALFESLFAFSDQEWALTGIARVGTAMVHILTSGLMGWALVQAWRHKKYIRLVVVFVGIVGLHGLWNGLSLLAVFSALAAQVQTTGISASQSLWLQGFSLVCLAAIAAFAFAGLLWANSRLQPPAQQAQASILQDNLLTDTEESASLRGHRTSDENLE